MSATTDTSPAVTAFPRGTMLRATRQDEYGEIRAGAVFEVEDYISASEAEDGHAFYIGSGNGWSGSAIRAECVELVMSAVEADARVIPSMPSIQSALSSAMHSMDASFTIDETSVSGTNAVEVYGETEEGLRFSFVVTVSDLHKTDL